MLPVSNYTVKYLKPIFYDELITVKTTINKIPSVKIEFDYEIYNSKKELLSVANTVLVFVNKKTMKPCRGPEALIDKIKQF